MSQTPFFDICRYGESQIYTSQCGQTRLKQYFERLQSNESNEINETKPIKRKFREISKNELPPNKKIKLNDNVKS